MNKKRIYNGCIFISLILIEIFIALFVHDDFIRPYIGDVIIVLVIYFFIKIIFIQQIKHLVPIIFIFTIIVEWFQYINILEILGLYHIEFLRILVGTTFSWADIYCYAVGCILILIYERLNFKRAMKKAKNFSKV